MEHGVHDKVAIKLLSEKDIPIITHSFSNWPKPRALFEKYLAEQNTQERLIWIAFHENELAGYTTLKWHSQYEPFQTSQIPEIMDLNVLPTFRKQGVGSKLLDVAEQEAAKQHSVVGIGVGLYEGYGAAQKLYIKRGYIPNGLPITYNYKPLEYGSKVVLDDDLVLWLTKTLTS